MDKDYQIVIICGCVSVLQKFENFNGLNVAFIGYKLTIWDSVLF